MSAKNKISGFFTALFLAVISFVIIYCFIPARAEEYFGTSLKSDKKAQSTVQTVTTELKDSANTSVFNIFKK